jgi:hypothetical protein
MGRLDGHLQSLIVLRTLRRRTIERRIKTAARDLKRAAQQAKRVIESRRFPERESYG